MEKSDLELIQKYAKDGNELETLYKEHMELDEEVSRIQSLDFVTPEEQSRLKILKKVKLEGRDKMEGILRTLRAEEGGS